MYNALELCLPICALVFSLVLFIAYFFKKKINIRENRMYSIMLICVLFDSVLVFLEKFFVMNQTLDNINPILSTIVCLFNKFDAILLILITSCLFRYIYIVTLEPNDRSYKCNTYTTYIINLIASFFILFLDIHLISDGNIISVSGSSLIPTYTVCVLYIILSILVTIFNYKKIAKKHIPLFFAILIFTFLIVVFYFNPYITVISISLTLLNYVMFFSIENPDVKMIEVLNEAKISAEKANRAKSDFLSSMSHEIRTPLNAIVGFSDCILEESSLDDAKNDAKDIKLASENLLEIVNGILDISKIEADKMEIIETDYNVLDVFDNVAKLVKPRIGDKPIEFNVKFAPDIPYMVHGDGGKVRQIVTNILTNAVKYTDKGSVSFLVNCVSDSEYTKLIISVEDTGRGIKPEQIDKLFAKFERLEEDRNTTLEGTGLGLAITKRFVEMLGGKIVVQSKYGEGSKFTVYLKQKIVKMNPPQGGSENELFNTTRIKLFDFSSSRVLVVDDNKINLKVALKLLSNYGIHAEAVESGFDCLERLGSGEVYDLILLDDMMPKMSGVETLKKIRETVIYDMPVIALTANALSGMKEKYLADGFDDYLSKPIEKNELYRILINHLHSKTSVVDLPKVRKDEESKIKISESISEKKDNIIDTSDRKRILVVDDNKLNIKIATKLLSDKNVIIDSALSGSEAIDKCRDNVYDLILMDIMMPEMDGVETLHHIKEDLDFKNPIIAVTADAVAGAEEKYLKEGFDYYVSKPINNDIINDILSKFLH